MTLVPGFPFELFLYRRVCDALLHTTSVTSLLCSIVFFVAALIERFRLNEATLQNIAASVIFFLVIMCLFLYWLITEPVGEQKVPSQTDVEVAVSN